MIDLQSGQRRRKNLRFRDSAEYASGKLLVDIRELI
jgi:hypothetical protein